MAISSLERAEEPGDPAARTRKRWFWAVIALFSVTATLELALHDHALVDPPPDILRAAAAAVGLTFGILAARSLMSRPNLEVGLRQILAFIVLPLLAATAGSYYARLAYEMAMFVGREPVSYSQWVVVKGIDGAGRRSLNYSATVLPLDGSREITVPIDEDLYFELEPYREPGRDCLILEGETSSSGIRRVHVPTKLLDTLIGMRQYRPCATAPADIRQQSLISARESV
ncbi:hypothetical protein L7H23_06010 [Sphingopyxis sp. BSN-002]|uniref:hypothetical protein n=1 Tax=Sphingopyxis sp. BSN-002 TaxID=2911495 RepID=UPI001EDC4823|nr:hypothetical protein [Sphingopyxis sp. BSN-002]UKK85660.1 hypothetical protein L7H23_06010 [Sphingopyxis sp. BSN-002]